ncbi:MULTISPECIES: translation elongation factor 4 [Sphaerochaeta]|uniref:Elongation factor 4 n=1 Tax=Sphaerochaeta associata TaxID=1129264 RepID=A0ABY4D7T2_9SPIR|nr:MULTISPECIES: translation elongation factor 4 [Sphaerochaeta]MDD2394447.1 translation elongation factor 4 [Sphaerochaeta sp.]MDD3422986.1 translation elongation factor 4 [Sphaerochaeta sp.]MDD3455789.1 translation elongation factor 4 [Sphaerochaeta sp.]UOM49960.1 translation elongation factor 4 [Sphaerochaeta associata]SMP53836.1 GTP-binding protein LepA [Sphaerochaeta associata]
MSADSRLTRNFCIIAHIDHGKSTLADRFIEMAHINGARGPAQAQILDNMDIERERGITIKSQAVTIPYTAKDGKTYALNLVDTPGHVDFSYEVSRAISSCEGALLLIDASQGVEAQTLANLYMAMEHDLTIIPVINKVDLASADIEACLHQIDHDLGLDSSLAVQVSAKTGFGVDTLFEAIVKQIKHPEGNDALPLQALIFDSHYDAYRGVIVHCRVFDGVMKVGTEIQFMHSGGVYKVEEAGVFQLELIKTGELHAGDVGYVITGVKTISDVRVGDTITTTAHPAKKPLPGFKDVKPVVFSSIYPVDTNDYEELVSAIERLKLNDASLIYEKDSSAALGFGFRCGFLGMLHLEVIQERIEREFDLSIVFTSPSVKYIVHLKNGETINIDNPLEYPDPMRVDYAEEPYIQANVITPTQYVGPIINLCMEKRGTQTGMNYLDEKRVELIYEMPLAEVLFEFYDRLKSISRGYASFDYQVIGYKRTDLVRLDILVNGEPVDALSQLVFRGSSQTRGRQVCERLRGEIPRQQYKIAIQAAIGGTIVSRETITAFRKDVTAKCYGGDISRKRKLLEKQKEGKKRMKMVGNVEIPQSAFLAVLKSGDDSK